VRDLDRALSDIEDIRGRLAEATAFRGFGPGTMAATGILAVITAFAQSAVMGADGYAPIVYFGGWIVIAVVSCTLIGIETVIRSRRIHSGLADEMILAAILAFLPAGAAGVFLTIGVFRFAPDTHWMLPGLWQVLVAIGIFAAARTLPPGVRLVGAWYFVAGFAVFALASDSGTRMDSLAPAAMPSLSPWLMGVPFAIGQIAMAIVLYRAAQEAKPDA